MSLLLALDAGNTFVKWAYHDGIAWRDAGRAATAHLIAGELAGAEFAHRPERVVIGNVAGEAAAAALARLCDGWHVVPRWVIARSSAFGVTNRYDEPARLGADRWAALVAARALTHRPCLVVSVGTAMTVDLLTGAGEFIGGIITPGPALMRTSLQQGTAGVMPGATELVRLPRSTEQAVEAGISVALSGTVERMAQILAAEAGAPPECLLTGGGAAWLGARLGCPFRREDTLVLDGLRRIAEEESRS